MPLWDLATRENWQLILNEKRTVTYKDGTSPVNDEYKYTAISPIYASPNSRTLLVGTYSESALPYWFLGARVSQYLYASPSPTTNLMSGVQTSDIKRVGLNRLTLVKFEDYGIYPYVLELQIPYWLEDIYVEVWEYQGQIDDVAQQHDINEILARLERIEQNIDMIGQ